MATVGFTGCPGLTNAVVPGVAGVPGIVGVTAPVSVGFPGRNGFRGDLPAVPVPAVAEGIVPGSLAGAVFAAVPGVSLAILACKAVVCFGSAMPFQPLSSFGAAIVAAIGGSDPDFLPVRVTIGAVTARTPPEICENFPSAVTGFVPV